MWARIPIHSQPWKENSIFSQRRAVGIPVLQRIGVLQEWEESAGAHAQTIRPPSFCIQPFTKGQLGFVLNFCLSFPFSSVFRPTFSLISVFSKASQILLSPLRFLPF
jgi:hypothetical protein